jgi:hypothetical protein
LDHTRDEGETLLQGPREQRSLGESAMSRDQSYAYFSPHRAVAKVEVAQITAVVALVVGVDAELEDLLFEITNDLIHRPWMDRASGYIDDPMTLRHV